MSQTLRPLFKKTFVKGVIALALFSLLLEVNTSNILNYLIFVGVSLALIALYAGYKHATVYTIDDEGVVLYSPLRRTPKRIVFSDVVDISVSQGVLAKRFDCGSVFLILRKSKGSYALMGGGYAEALRDVPHPHAVYELISSMLTPNV
ncbi:MAG: PH domain-containing protein [Thermoprotei archaeon]